MRAVDGSWVEGYKKDSYSFTAMSEEQLSAFFQAVKEDTELQEKLKGANDLDGAITVAKEAGFEVSTADWNKAKASQALDMSDEELAAVSGGNGAGMDEKFTVTAEHQISAGEDWIWVGRLS